jgi:hypothetical protein
MLLASSVTFACEPFDVRTQREHDLARDWLNQPPATKNARDLPASQWQPVSTENQAKAATALEDSSWTPLTNQQVSTYVSGTAQAKPSPNAKPYLLRGIGIANGEPPRTVRLMGHSVAVEGGVLGDCPAAMRRHPVVVWLPFPPNTVFVTFSQAK